jgi:hypothetical protein
MKNPLITGFFMASASTFFGQTKIEYNLCDLDFRPLSLHNDLPQNAIYTNSKASATARALDVVNRLTFDENLTLTGGWNSMHFPGVP